MDETRSGHSAVARNDAEGPRGWRNAISVALQPSRTIDWVMSVLLVLASIALGAVHVPQHTSVSPIDEYVYIDYLQKFPTQFVVHRGEETGEYARLYLSCHGVRTVGNYPEEFCSNWRPADAAELPNGGLTTADIYTPLYFGVTWLLSQPLHVLGVEDITLAGRLTGWTWLAAASVLLYLTLRRWKLPPILAAGGGLLLIGSLPAFWSNTYISTDATSLLAGSLMLFGLTLFARPGPRATWLFGIFAVLVTLAKLQNILAVAAAGLTLLILTIGAAARGPRGERMRAFLRDRRTWAAVAAVAASAAAQAIWVAIRSAIAIGPSPDQGVATSLTRNALFSEMFTFFPGVADGALTPTIAGFPAPIIAVILGWVIVAGVFGLLAVSARGSMHEALALSTLVVVVLAGPFLAVATTLVTGYYFALPARYGMPLLPFMLACACLLFVRSVWTRWLLPILAVVSYGLVLALPGG